MSEAALASIGIETNAEHLLATPRGARLLGECIIPTLASGDEPDDLPYLGDYVRAFADDPDDAEETFASYNLVEGNQSQLYSIGHHPEAGPLFLKVSTPASTSGLPEGERRYGPEDLVLQMQFLNSLKHLFEQQDGVNISVPEHLVAMRLDSQHSLTVMQYLPGLTDVDTWIHRRQQEGMRATVRQQKLRTIATRIQDAIKLDPKYRPPIGDLFYDEERGHRDRRHILRGENVLMAPGTKPDKVDTAHLWVIDYPPPFRAYSALARAALQNADHYPGPYVEWRRSAA